MLEKLRRKGYPIEMQSLREGILDIAGVRVVCNYLNDVNLVADLLLSQDDIRLLKKKDFISKKPLNNRLYPVSTQCLNRHLRLVKVISAQSSHYVSVFLLRFPKKGRLPLYQVVESFRPAMASAYRFAQANMAYSRFSFFFRPRYTVFL